MKTQVSQTKFRTSIIISEIHAKRCDDLLQNLQTRGVVTNRTTLYHIGSEYICDILEEYLNGVSSQEALNRAEQILQAIKTGTSRYAHKEVKPKDRLTFIGAPNPLVESATEKYFLRKGNQAKHEDILNKVADRIELLGTKFFVDGKPYKLYADVTKPDWEWVQKQEGLENSPSAQATRFYDTDIFEYLKDTGFNSLPLWKDIITAVIRKPNEDEEIVRESAPGWPRFTIRRRADTPCRDADTQ